MIDSLARYTRLRWKSFFFRILKALVHYLFASVTTEKSEAVLIFDFFPQWKHVESVISFQVFWNFTLIPWYGSIYYCLLEFIRPFQFSSCCLSVLEFFLNDFIGDIFCHSIIPMWIFGWILKFSSLSCLQLCLFAQVDFLSSSPFIEFFYHILNFCFVILACSILFLTNECSIFWYI